MLPPRPWTGPGEQPTRETEGAGPSCNDDGPAPSTTAPWNHRIPRAFGLGHRPTNGEPCVALVVLLEQQARRRLVRRGQEPGHRVPVRRIAGRQSQVGDQAREGALQLCVLAGVEKPPTSWASNRFREGSSPRWSA